MVRHQRDQAGAVFRGVAGCDQFLDRRREAHRHRAGAEPEIGGPHHLALAHQDAAGHLGQELAGADAHQKLFDLPEVGPAALMRSA